MESHDQRADELESEADRLEQASDRVGKMIKDTREEWDSNVSSQQVPGAMDEAAAAPGGLGEEEEGGEQADQDGEDQDDSEGSGESA